MAQDFTPPEGYELVEVIFDGFIKIERWRVPDTENLRIVVRCTNSVACMMVDTKRKKVLFIDETHVADMGPHNPLGKLITPVAGRFDVNLGPCALAQKEAREEAGVVLDEKRIELLNHGRSMVLSIGLITERAFLSVVQITEDDLEGNDDQQFGVRTEGERIHRVWIDEEAFLSPTFIADDLRVFAYQQWLRNVRLLEQNQQLQRQLAELGRFA